MRQKSHLKHILPKYVKNRYTLKRNIRHLTNFVNSNECQNVGLKLPLRPSQELSNEQMRIIVKCRAVILRNKAQLAEAKATIDSYLHLVPSLQSRNSRQRRQAINETLSHLFSDSDESFQALLDEIDGNETITTDSEYRRALSSFVSMMRSRRQGGTSSQPDQSRRQSRNRTRSITRQVFHRIPDMQARAILNADSPRYGRGLWASERHAEAAGILTQNPFLDVPSGSHLITPFPVPRNDSGMTNEDDRAENSNTDAPENTAANEQAENNAEVSPSANVDNNAAVSGDSPQNTENATRVDESLPTRTETRDPEARQDRIEPLIRAPISQRTMDLEMERYLIPTPSVPAPPSRLENTERSRHRSRLSDEQIMSRITALQRRINELQDSIEEDENVEREGSANNDNRGFNIPKKVQEILDKSDCNIIDDIYDPEAEYDLRGESMDECDCSDSECSCPDDESFMPADEVEDETGRWVVVSRSNTAQNSQNYQSESNVTLRQNIAPQDEQPEAGLAPSGTESAHEVLLGEVNPPHAIPSLQSPPGEQQVVEPQPNEPNDATQISSFVNESHVHPGENDERSHIESGHPESIAQAASNFSEPDARNQNAHDQYVEEYLASRNQLNSTYGIDSETLNMQAALMESIQESNNVSTQANRGGVSQDAESPLVSASNPGINQHPEQYQPLEEGRFELRGADGRSISTNLVRSAGFGDGQFAASDALQSHSLASNLQERLALTSLRNTMEINSRAFTIPAGRNHPTRSGRNLFEQLNRHIEREKKLKPLTPLAIVGEVEPESLASFIGLKKHDRVLQFGTLNSSNTTSIKSLEKLVTKYYNKDLTLIITRNEIEFDVLLPKHMWKGSKKLGFVWKKIRNY